MEKQLTDEQLEQLATAAKVALEQSVWMWTTAMNIWPLNSYEYRKICAAGTAAQEVHDILRALADDRSWTDERIAKCFYGSHVSFR
jgi:hypothetical protein